MTEEAPRNAEALSSVTNQRFHHRGVSHFCLLPRMSPCSGQSKSRPDCFPIPRDCPGCTLAMASSQTNPRAWTVPDFADRVSELKHRLAFADVAPEVPGSGWNYGVPRDVVLRWVKFWKEEYDWQGERAKINSLPHYLYKLSDANGGTDLHFIHLPSSRPDALPLMLLHGWPGSFVEFLNIVPLLAEPTDSRHQAFHVVVPSLPGYGFSEAPKKLGYGPIAIARACDELMGALGYNCYASQGGDWGGFITRCLAAEFPHRCRAIHLNMISAPEPTLFGAPVAYLAAQGYLPLSWALTPSELRHRERTMKWGVEESGYHLLQRTRPQTVAYALTDSPTGLLAWILEKFRAWSDGRIPDGPVDPGKDAFTIRVMTNIHIYYLTRSAGSAARLYREAQKTGDLRKVFFRKIVVPTGVSMFEKEQGKTPRRWCAPWYDIRFWAEHPKGGHFAAMEEPETLAGDLRHFFGRDDIRRAIGADVKAPAKL
ncbi:epocide hydrolase domain-containing protein [Hyaloraphidium curvatum]|nr:epocide hydrolase domain-containing protein [Hyaloraphidium curvatum]